ncbi:hypothetical protein Bca4012_050080 [Brassica carinata]|uniref:(rape) hypothetical protein n=1 Tax=Brassica napus TaxID=3708 RepID=A0A816K814_BRANA|nr:unnamed protein product [Brassica napus]
MANIFLIASGSRRTRRAMKSKNPQEKRSNRAMKSKNPQEKRSNSISVNNFSCKKHKKHRQSPGICSLCLTERLSKISIEYYEYTKNVAKKEASCCSSFSSSTSVSSCYSSSQSLLVPLHCNIGSERRRRMGRNIALYSDYCSDPS